jgi:pimeloyl-ACP methyl ester carboxylesterase
MPYVTTGKPRIYYELRGLERGPTLVLLRGMGRGVVHWEGVIDGLENSFRLLLLDNRGVGRSEPSPGSYSTAHMAHDVVRVLDHLGIERSHVFGMSLGGMVAQRLALDHRSRVDRLVLGCTSAGVGRAIGGKPARANLRAFWSLARARIGGSERAVRAEARLLLSDAFRREHPEVVDRWIEAARRAPMSPAALAQQLLAAARHRALDELEYITAPTLVISSDSDPLVPPENSRLLARRIAGAELSWIPGAGHDFATERPAHTARLLERFLSDRSSD